MFSLGSAGVTLPGGKLVTVPRAVESNFVLSARHCRRSCGGAVADALFEHLSKIAALIVWEAADLPIRAHTVSTNFHISSEMTSITSVSRKPLQIGSSFCHPRGAARSGTACGWPYVGLSVLLASA